MSETNFRPGETYTVTTKHLDGRDIIGYMFTADNDKSFVVYCFEEYKKDNRVHSVEIVTPDRVTYTLSHEFKCTKTIYPNDDFCFANWFIYELEWNYKRFAINHTTNSTFVGHSCRRYLESMSRQHPDILAKSAITVKWVDTRLESCSRIFFSGVYKLTDHGLVHVSGDRHSIK